MNSSSGDWVIYQEVPRSVLLAAVDDFYLKSLFIIGVAILTALGLALFIAGEIINPLLDLQRKANAFAQGQEFPPLPDELPLYELGSLTHTFHEMADELGTQRRMRHALIRRLIDAQEEERKLIAYDLHDGLIQQLVGARLYVSMIREMAEDPSRQLELRQQLEKSGEALTEAITEGRRIIEGLHPTVLDDLGLEEAIADLAHKNARIHDWNLQLKLEKLPEPPDKVVSVTIFRIVQEAMSNIGKHAHASHVRISMSDGDMIRVCVEDDGVGFEVDGRKATARSGLGVTTMRERAALIDGSCLLESSPGKGTRIRIQVPVTHGSSSTNNRNHPTG
jgi:signal transduction histidine kinase